MPRVTARPRGAAGVVGPALAVVAVAGVLGVLAGFVWLLLAEPAQWRYTEQGLALDELAAGRQFGVVAWFVLIGVVVGLVGGWTLERLRSADGWLLVPLVVAAGLVGAVLCSRVGLAFGPPDPASVTGIAVGDHVPMRFELGAFAPLLSWVIGGLVGVAASVYLRPSERASHADRPGSADDRGHRGAGERDEIAG